MARLRYNLLEGALAADLDIGATTITLVSALQEGGVNVPTITGSDIIALRIDQEVMYLTAYTAGATTGTVSRGQEDTVEADHFAGAAVKNVITKEDFSGGSGVFGILVAASDSSPADQARADYVCTGTSDQTTLQAAVDDIALQPLEHGQILLAPGTYNVTATTSITGSSSNIVFKGTSLGVYPDDYYGTTIRRSGVSNYPIVTMAANTAVAFENVALFDPADDANTNPLLTCAASCNVNISRSYFENWGTGDALQVTGNNTQFFIEESYIGGITAIKVTGGTYTSLVFRVRDSELSGFPWAIDAAVGGSARFFFDNVETRPIKIDGNISSVPMPRVEFDGGIVYSSTDESIYLTDISTLMLSNLEVRSNSGSAASGIRLSNVDSGKISGLVMGDDQNGFDHHGIWVLDSDNLLIEGNLIFNASATTDNTYSGIILDGNTNNCTVINNKITTDGSGNLPLYGIRIDDSTCDNNFISNNDLRGSAKTNGNEISDNGTGTRGQEVLVYALSDETTAIAATGQKLSVRMPYNFVVTRCRASLNTASASGGPFTIDVEEAGASIFTTNLLIIDDTELTSLTATQPSITDPYIADDAIVTFDVDDVGDGTATGAKVTLYGWRI